MSTHETLRMSWWNVVLTLVALAAAGFLAIRGDVPSALVMAAAAIAVAASAVYARSGRSSDFTRINAAEYVDERDRQMGARAFAIVGVVAIVLSLGTFVAVVLTVGRDASVFWLSLGQLVVLLLAWVVANVIAVRRS